jgi:alpha-tubulin suppressor-like RCC1 family protein
MNEDILFQIAINLPIKDVIHLCQSNIKYNELLCDNQRFWKMKYRKDFGPNTIFISDWKEAYIHFGNTYGLGFNVITGNRITDKEPNPILVSYKEYAWYQLISNYYNKPAILKTKKITCGHLHTVVIDINNDIWVFGENRHQQLGVKYYPNLPSKLNKKALDIASGGYHNLFIDLDYNLYGFGSNNSGQLGNNDDLDAIYNLYIKAKQIACGEHHSLFIDMDDNVWGMGDNRQGQLGLGHNNERNQPTLLGIKAKAIAAGNSHSIFVDFDDNVWVFGNNKAGQLGLGDYDNRSVPTPLNVMAKLVSCGGAYTMLIDMNDNLWGFGSNVYLNINAIKLTTPTFIASRVIYVTCGETHGLYVTIDAIGHGFGNNKYHQVDIPNTLRIHHAGCGTYHTVLATY